MGYRANVVTQHRKYGSQTFSDWENFTNGFVPAMQERGIHISGNDNEDYFEVDKLAIVDYVNRTPSDSDPSPYPGLTNEELNQALSWAIKETNDAEIAWEWF